MSSNTNEEKVKEGVLINLWSVGNYRFLEFKRAKTTQKELKKIGKDLPIEAWQVEVKKRE